MATPGRVPVSERQVDHAVAARRPDHLVQQGNGVGDVFKDVGREADIRGAVSERQAQPVAANCAARRAAAARELAMVGLDQQAAGAAGLKGASEMARAAAKVNDGLSSYLRIPIDLPD